MPERDLILFGNNNMKQYLWIILITLMPLSLQAGHPWSDVLVIPGGSNAPKDVVEVVIGDAASTSPTVECWITVDTQHYLRAVDYYGGNRGAILMFRDLNNPPAFASLYSYLRPYSIKGDRATFLITVSREMLKMAYFAYIPEQGDSRYLFSLRAFLNHQVKTKPKTKEDKQAEQAMPSDGHKPTSRVPSDGPTAPADAH